MQRIMAKHAADLFRERVRSMMDDRHLTITDLAEAIGTSRPSMSRILSGDENVTIERAERIAKFFQKPLAVFFSEKLAHAG